MSGKDRQVLEKISRHIENAMKYSHRFEDINDFEADSMCVEACVFNLMQIGELARIGLSDEVKQQIKGVPWNRIYGIRDRIMDERDGVKIDIVWEMTRERLPIILTGIKEYV